MTSPEEPLPYFVRMANLGASELAHGPEVVETLRALRDLPELLGRIAQTDRAALYQALGLTVRYRRIGSTEEIKLTSTLRSVDLECVGGTQPPKTPRSQLKRTWTWSVSEDRLAAVVHAPL